MNALPSMRPVPGFEALVWSGEQLRVEANCAQRVRIARVGEDDAVLVCSALVGTNPVLISRHLRGAFTRWPPEIGPAVEHQSLDFRDSHNVTGPLMAWPDGTFAARTGVSTIVATVDKPGASWAFPGVACFEPAPLEGMYLFATEHGQTRVLHRSRRAEEAHVVFCGDAPAATHQVVTELGTLLLASVDKDGSCQLFVVTRSGVRKAAQISGAEHSRCFLIARRGGGAFVLLGENRLPGGLLFSQRVDEDGQPLGERYTHPRPDYLVAAAAWNDGFVLQLSRGLEGLAAVVSDGVNATCVPGGEIAMLEGSPASSSDGRVVLFARGWHDGLHVARLVAGGPELALGATPATPITPVAVRTPPIAAPQFAGPPAYVPPKLGTRDELVPLLLTSEFATGDLRSGTFEVDSGQGAHCVLMWDEAGLVALGHDHDGASEWRLPLDLREPGKYLLDVPPALAELAMRATDHGARLAIEGYWVEAGERPAYRASSTEVLEQFLGTREGRESAASGETSSDEGAEEHALAQLVAEQATREASLALADRALLAAAKAGDLEGVKKALSEGANINVPMIEKELDSILDGHPPLEVALRHHHMVVAEFLIGAGADVTGESGRTALRAAATQGNVELTRALLARGANVVPDQASRGLLQQMVDAYPRPQQERAPAYAEVIRMLLDAGAPLPNDSRCNILIAMAVAGGAPELEARLRRVYAEVVLPQEPPPIDTSASGARVSDLLARATGAFTRDTVETLTLLVEAWQLTLNPRIGDAAEGLARMIRGTRPALPTGSHPVNGEALLAEVKAMREGPIDPRAVRVILAWLWTTDIYTSKAWIAKTEDEAAAVLVRLRDVRFKESLELHCEIGRPLSSHPVRASLKLALRAIKEVVPGTLTEADVEHLGTIEEHLANRRPSAQRSTIRDLFAAVYDAPEEDEPRRALSARLTEAGDPRGEFIQLQMDRGEGEVTMREKELVKEHGRAWLGEIGSILEGDVAYERGFLTHASLVGGNSGGPWYRVLPSGAGTQLEWSTVRRLALAGRESPGFLRGARTLRIAELIDVNVGHLKELLGGAARTSLERLDLAGVRGHQWTNVPEQIWTVLPDKLPSLTSLQMGAHPDGIGGAARIVTRLPHLRELAIGSNQAGSLAELIALARQRNLEKVCSLGLTDFTFTLSSGLLEITFDGVIHPKQASIAEEALASAHDLGIKRVVVHTPPRAKIEPDAKGRPAKLKRRTESLPLWPILEAVESLGLACEFEP